MGEEGRGWRGLTLSHPEALPWWVKSYSVRQSKLTKGPVLAGLGEKGLRERDGQIGPVKMGGCAGAREAGETAVGETSANPCGYGEKGHKSFF